MSIFMQKKIEVNTDSLSLQEVFPRFVAHQIANGVSEKTVQTYKSHLHSISKHFDLSIPFADLTQDDINACIVSMRQSGLAHNSVSSYARVLRTFTKWCREQGYTSVVVPNIRDRETVKETYTESELKALLRKPNKKCDFTEYRNWVIINFLLNCGCRAATIRNIKNKDIALQTKQVVYRHTKNGKVQYIPLCNQMVSIFREYTAIREGDADDYLFCSEYGEMLSEDALREAIYKYNRSRGVRKTSIHAFRHSFARMYLVDCGGDAFTLQKLLGHSTLVMTKHYCTIYDQDIANNFDKVSPLARISAQKQKIKK